MIRLLVVLTLCVAFVCSPFRAQAQQPELVTANNITSFTIFHASDHANPIACQAKGADRVLGTLTLGNRPAGLIAVGAVFTPLSPTMSEREARLRKQINAGLRVLKRAGSEKAKKQARRRLKVVQKELSQLSAFSQSCATFVPATAGNTRPTSPLPSAPQIPGGAPNVPSNPNMPGDSSNRPYNPSNPGQPTYTPEPEYFIDDVGVGPTHVCSPTTVAGTVSGGGSVTVTLANDSFVEAQDVVSGSFAFGHVPPGEYRLFAEGDGASFGPTHTVVVRTDGDCKGISLVAQELPKTEAFAFRWRQQDALTSGLEQYTKVSLGRSAANLISPPLNQTVQESRSLQSSAADKLESRYQISLESKELKWGSEHAERLLQALDGLWSLQYDESPVDKPSSWVLTPEYLPNDIEILNVNGALQVRISSETFRYAALTPAVLDGVRGQFFSERLTLAALRFLSGDGRDRGAIEQILVQKFAVSVVNDLNAACGLTYQTTRECDEAFQLFSSDELLQIAAAFAQLPPSGEQREMLVLMRRKNGVRHPGGLDKAKIIPYTNKKLTPYFEFSREAFLAMDSAGMRNPVQPIKEILLPGVIAAHASFLWDRVLVDQLKEAWITQTEWRLDPATGAWTNDNPTEVGASLPVGVVDSGPKGDFATSVTKYLVAPEELKFRSPRRFEFLKLYIMHGLRYTRKFREDLKFPVLNLRPDFAYPGKIKEAEVVISGAAESHKNMRMKITLEGNDPMEHGASMTYLTLRHKLSREQIYVVLYPERPDPVYGTSLVLKANQSISKYQQAGFYEVASIVIVDTVGNVTVQKPNSVGLKFFLNNTAVPPEPAELEPGSVKLSISETIAYGTTVPMFTTEFKVKNPEALESVFDSLINLNTPRERLMTNTIPRLAGNTVRISRPVSPFIPSDLYGVSGIELRSAAQGIEYKFSLDALMSGGRYLPMPLVEYENSNGDVTAPELDLNSLSVSAQTLAPDKPNGATKVVVKMKAKDDLSGLRLASYCLRSPLDRLHCGAFDLQLQTDVLPDGTTEFKEYRGEMYLPAGSAPGEWGVDQVYAVDKVGNGVTHRLSEIVKFIVDNSSAQ